MDAELKTEWVAALRSGDYKQDFSTLNSGYGFCCLGVLCDIVGRKYPDKVSETVNSNGVTYYNGAISYLPEKVMQIADLDSYSGRIPGGPVDDRGYATLAHMNDNGESFNKIADVIEKRF